MQIDMRNLIIIIGLVIGALLLWIKYRRILNNNLQLLANLLNGDITFPLFRLPFYTIVKGHYKGRIVICCYNLVFRKTGQFSICIEPLGLPKRSELTSFPRQGPTEYTFTSGSRIYYSGPSGTFFKKDRYIKPNLPGTLLKPLNREDMIFFFEQLTTAAEMMEKREQTQLIRR